MAKFEVTVTRTSFSILTFDVDVPDEKVPEGMEWDKVKAIVGEAAINEAGNKDFGTGRTGSDAYYDVDHIEHIETP